MNQVDETFRRLRKMTNEQILLLNQKWYRDATDRREWYDVLYDEGGWTVSEWDHFQNTERDLALAKLFHAQHIDRIGKNFE